MIGTILTLIVAASMYPLAIFIQHYFSAWKRLSNLYPQKDTERGTWMHVFGLRIDNLMLRNSSKICLEKNYLIISGSGLRSLIAPKIFIPYGDIAFGRECYIVKNVKHDISFKLVLDSSCSMALNAKIP